MPAVSAYSGRRAASAAGPFCNARGRGRLLGAAAMVAPGETRPSDARLMLSSERSVRARARSRGCERLASEELARELCAHELVQATRRGPQISKWLSVIIAYQ